MYTIDQIIKLLPHRFPFLLVDRVESITPGPGPLRVGRKARAIKNVTYNEPYFPGHFPHKPVMPGVLQIETMAQVAALASVDPTGPKMDVLIAGINDARFRRPVVPGDQLIVETEVIKDRGSMMVIACKAFVGQEIACEAEILAKIFPLAGG
jgi:3-hydroxyacyl-[acyl-carrier-protein] dehydratase